MPAVFDGVSYSLSPSLSPTRRSQLSTVLDANGAAKHPPYTHLIAPVASRAHNNATNHPALKLVTDRWVDRSIVMGKQQSEQYYSPDPAMIFSGVVACATDLSAADLEVLSAGITALGGQWRVGLTRDVTHLFALRTGSDKYNTALHFAPQTHMCILTPHWFDDSVRLGRCIPETPYTWPDPPVLRPGMTLDLDDDEGARKRKGAPDTDAQAGHGNNVGEHVRVWAGCRILLSTSLELADSSRRAIEARVQRAGALVVPVRGDADEDVEEKAVDEADVLVTRWRSGKAYFKAARASLIIGTLTWLFSVESSGTLHSPLDSLLWYPTPRGGIPDLIDCEISVTNYTGAARDYLKRLITLIGAKFTPSLSQSNKVLIAGFQPSPKTTRALSWSIPVVNHTWLEDCFVEWRALTVGLERYIVYPPRVDFGGILLTRQEGPPSPQSGPAQRGGAVPGGRGIGTIDLAQEEARDADHRARERGALGLSTSHEALENATTVDGMSMIEEDILTESRAPPRSRAGSVKKTPPSSRVKRGSISTLMTASATGAFVDHVINLPVDDDNDGNGERRTPAKGKQHAWSTLQGPRASTSRTSSVGLFSAVREVEVIVRNSGGKSTDGNKKCNNGKNDTEKQQIRSTKDAKQDKGALQPKLSPKPKPGLVQNTPDIQSAHTDDEAEEQGTTETSGLQRRVTKRTISSDLDLHPNTSEGLEAPVPPPKPPSGSMTPIKSGMKSRPKSKSQSKPSAVLEEEREEEERVVATKSGSTTGAGRRQELAKPTRTGAPVENGDEKEKTGERKETKSALPRPRSLTRSLSPTLPGANNSRTPKRRLSVVVPSVPKEYFSSQGAMSEGDDVRAVRKKTADSVIPWTKRKQLMPVASTSTSKRGRPSPAQVSPAMTVSGKSKPQSQVRVLPKPRADRDEDMGKEEEDSVVSMVVDTPVTSLSRGGTRRSAASKATTRLRDEIMPDVVNFEKEQKQAKRRRGVGGESVAAVREEEVRGEKRRRVASEEEDEEAEAEDVMFVPSIKVKSKPIDRKGKAKGTTAVGSDEDEVNPPVKSGSQEKKGTRGRGRELAAVRLTTTGVILLDDVIKRLTRLGVQMTTKPTDCTHLIAKGIVRTEKFLCAMSVSPHVLTEEWANASARSGKLLPEGDYSLSDLAAEQKWAFKFTDAMSRAKGPEGGANLFRQMTFYVTPKVSVNAKLLKNVISAGGGQVQTSTMPTVRILKGKANRFVVSCQEDKGIWWPLVQDGFKVYSPELVLRGSLRQEIEWEREECIIAG